MRTTVGLSILVWAWLGALCPAHPVAEQYVRDLQSQDIAVRREAAASLGRLGQPWGVPVLIRALDDPEKAVRREAAKALGSIKDARAVPALLEAIDDVDRNVRFYAAYALGEIKDSRATGALVDALRDPEWTVRDQAAWALREIGDPRVIGPLVALLKQKSADAPHVVWILRQVDAEEASRRVAELLDDPDAAVRVRAVRVLNKLEDEAAVEPLIAALKDSDPNVRRCAVQALATHRNGRVVKALEGLTAEESDPAIREAAEKAAWELSRHEALAAHWSFDDGDLQVAKDITGDGSDGEIHACKSVEGKIGKGLQFGEGAYIELGKPKQLPMASTPLTVAAWIKSDAPNGVVIARGGAFCGISLYIKDGLPKFGVRHVEEGVSTSLKPTMN